LPDLRIVGADLGQARDQCAFARADAHAKAILPTLQVSPIRSEPIREPVA
jgi:hypothetical protein